MSHYNNLSEIIFIFMEFSYLILCLIYIFSPIKLLLIFIYPLAAIKFSLSSTASFDIKNYEKVYDIANGFSFDPVMEQEGAFVSLLYFFKSINFPLFIVHGLEIIGFLLAVKFLFESFLPTEKAIAISFLFGLFSATGEMGTYLLRQLLSTSLVFVALGFLFRDKKIWSWVFFGFSFLFHSSSFAYIPLFVSTLFHGKYTKAFVIVGGYAVLIMLAINTDLGTSAITSLTGEHSVYVTKHNYYTQLANQSGWRDQTIGTFSKVMIAYFVGINIWKKGLFWKSQYWMYYLFTIVITFFYLLLEESRLFWLSSRFNFISDIFILSSCLLITIEIIPERDHKLFITLVSLLLFSVSVLIILVGYDSNVLFKVPF